jgi:general secretion pathway protein J
VRQPGDGAEAGFTLLEMLIVLALLAVIASLLVEAIASTRLALQASDRQVSHGAVPAAQAVLRRLIAEVRPGPDASQRLDLDRAFIGGRDRVSFVSSFVAQGQFGGLWRYDLALDPDGVSAAPGALVIAQRLLRPATANTPGGPPPSTRSVLLKGVQDVRLRYFGVLEGDRAPQWHDSWQHPSRLPLLISVDVLFAEKDQPHWTTVVVSPSLGPSAL